MQLAQFCFLFVLIAMSVCSAKRIKWTNEDNNGIAPLSVGDELVVDLIPRINQAANLDMIWSHVVVDQARTDPLSLTQRENTMEEDGSVWAVFEATAPGTAIVQSTLSCKIPTSSVICPLAVQTFKATAIIN
ncbi:hypothetical protein BC940DRAFT_287428 [Gongronella butleri]|nr:hypothetical protein BC940DRAFT_287428 [Gongronella butleri]